MAKKKKISGAAICLEKIDNCDDKQIIDIPFLRAGFTTVVTEAAAYNVIWRLRGVGALIAEPGSSLLSSINRKKMNAFLDTHTPNSPYFQARNGSGRGGRKKHTRRGVDKPRTEPSDKGMAHIPRNTQVETPEDIDVINNLLDAMAQAEPILNKLKAIYEAVHS